MALKPDNDTHARQIQAGTKGRKAGHAFEDDMAREINALKLPYTVLPGSGHVSSGDPALALLNYVAAKEKFATLARVRATATGGLATSETGKSTLVVGGKDVSRCKSDLILELADGRRSVTVGVSVKQCNNAKPTNAQLYFTTANGFATLLRENSVPVSQTAIDGLRQFCGDPGFRPSDDSPAHAGRKVDTRRFFWEEIRPEARREWEQIFAVYQDEISTLLFQKAYSDDSYPPAYLLHKTKRANGWNSTETAIYGIDELVGLSKQHCPFSTKAYSVYKGSFRDPPDVKHLAPRFGIIQMQRGGQTQHPSQLQFNLETGYFYKLENIQL